MNINIGGTKHWTKVSESVRKKWKVLDVAGVPDFKYNLNGMNFFPIEDNRVDNYYSSHTLEHIEPKALPFVLSEIRRTLKTDGLLRVVVPDVKLAIDRYAAGDSEWLYARQEKARATHGYPATDLGRLTLWFYSQAKGTTRSGHRNVFDWPTLNWYLKKAGFRNIMLMNYNVCHEVFRGLDLKTHIGLSLYVEAQK